MSASTQNEVASTVGVSFLNEITVGPANQSYTSKHGLNPLTLIRKSKFVKLLICLKISIFFSKFILSVWATLYNLQ